MIKIYALYDRKLVTDITQYCKTISWSGDISQCARKLECTLAYAIFDKNQNKTQIGPGTLVWLQEDGKELFRGIVFDRELSSSGELKFTAYDYLIYFLKSKVTYNFTNIISEAATEKIITDLGVKYNRIPTVEIPITLLVKAKPAYDAIMEIYTMLSPKTGKKYIPIMDADQVSVIEKGAIVDNFILQPETNLGNATFNDSISNMINKVQIIDEKGNYIGKVENTGAITAYGVLQDIYEYNTSDSQNATAMASGLLKNVERTFKATALGNSKIITGYALKTQIFYIDILQNATMYIDADAHTWDVATGLHTMELTLNFDNIMNEKEA